MDEADSILAKLNARLKAARNNTEREGILQKIEDIKRQYEGYLRDLNSTECMTTQQLPREPPPKDTAPHIHSSGYTQVNNSYSNVPVYDSDAACRKACGTSQYMPTSSQRMGASIETGYVPKEVKIGM